MQQNEEHSTSLDSALDGNCCCFHLFTAWRDFLCSLAQEVCIKGILLAFFLLFVGLLVVDVFQIL